MVVLAVVLDGAVVLSASGFLLWGEVVGRSGLGLLGGWEYGGGLGWGLVFGGLLVGLVFAVGLEGACGGVS